jgi:hypothetical protein
MVAEEFELHLRGQRRTKIVFARVPRGQVLMVGRSPWERFVTFNVIGGREERTKTAAMTCGERATALFGRQAGVVKRHFEETSDDHRRAGCNVPCRNGFLV